MKARFLGITLINTSIVLVMMCFLLTNATAQDLIFKNLTTLDGLSQSHVRAIIKDKYGFMWFGTEEGLNKYDGYKFTIYKHDPDDESSISNNGIYDILEDNNGNIWIATLNGLNKFDREKNIFTRFYLHNSEFYIRDLFQDSKNRIWLGTANGLYLVNDDNVNSFTHFSHDADNNNSISDNMVYRIVENEEGALWIGTKNGLNLFNPKTQKFKRYYHTKDNSKSIGSNCIKTVYIDSKKRLWIGTRGSGIAIYNDSNDSFTNFSHNPQNWNSVGHNDILSFIEGKDGKLWVGTENGGISVFDYERNIFTTHQQDINNPSSLSNNSIYALYQDDIGNTWVGTFSGGINFASNTLPKFRHYQQDIKKKNGLSNSIILSITGDAAGNIWIGTDGGGLNVFDRSKQTFTAYKKNLLSKNSISTDYVLSVREVSPGVLAFGHHFGGLNFLDVKTGKITLGFDDPALTDLSKNGVSLVFQDSQKNLWFGTYDGGGLYRIEATTGKSTRYTNDLQNKNTISGTEVMAMLEDADGSLWIGTDKGLDHFNQTTNVFTHYINNRNNKKSLSHNKINSLLQDKLGNLWIGTAWGLNYFDTHTKTFKVYTEKDGLPNNVILGILQDSRGNLWLSSNKGLSTFDITNETFRNFTTTDGLQGNEFKPKATYKAPDGTMFFGGVNGFNVFHPDSIQYDYSLPPIAVTDFQIFNKEVKVDKGSVLEKHINHTREIRLSHRQSVFTFEFAALNFAFPKQNNYAYKLEGFDHDWNYVKNNRTATYTNLDAGTYIFHIKATNNDGIWNEHATSVKVIITPPFWQTWWFRTILLLVIAGSLIAFYRIRIGVIQAQRSALETQVLERTEQLAFSTEIERRARYEAEKARQDAEQANRAKSVFLATMSHEIRTPMNGVIGMASLLAETPLNDEQKDYTQTIRTCGESLLTVINDILDYSKIESGKLELENKDFDLRTCMEEVLDVFGGKAAETNLDLIYHIDQNVPVQLIGDSLRLRQILVNLVSNAVKFTQRGEIFLGAKLNSCNEESIEITFEVRDTGIGIPADKLDRLFKAFTQVDSSTTRKYGGTGLGLVICEKLVKLMDGNIQVQSVVDQGTVFTFSIKTKISHQTINTGTANNKNVQFEGKKILVIDDNATNRKILKTQLELWKITPVLANSAETALTILSHTQDFDLVLTDMQMPGLDGIELAQRIKQSYANLPVILLSSLGDDRSKAHIGLFSAVLTKPVKQALLLKQISAILGKSEHRININEISNTERLLTTDFADKNPMKILVAEDNPVNMKLAQRVLQKLGYKAGAASNGAEVLKAITTDYYDVILMDVQMPEMDGLEATRTIRSQHGAQPFIIAMTANAMQGDREICIEAGMDNYISKPLHIEELTKMLTNCGAQFAEKRKAS
jgi:signal transduction histidine kinase/ligand-binding sensor domain-containing protein/DNA-binding response OmpR family regulator